MKIIVTENQNKFIRRYQQIQSGIWDFVLRNKLNAFHKFDDFLVELSWDVANDVIRGMNIPEDEYVTYRNQLINFILTNPGERFFDPAFGAGVRNLLFEQNTDFTSLEESLKDLIERYVQNIIIKELTITPSNSNTVSINIFYSINNMSDELSIQVNNELSGELI